MTLMLNGYLRDNPGGAAVTGKTVYLYDVLTGVAPVTTAHTNLSATTDVTDANGEWGFTMDLCTGPLKVQADLGAGNYRNRENDEVFQYNGYFINAVPAHLRAFSDGVIHGVGSEMAVTPGAVRTLSIAAGYATIKGYLLGWDSGTKSLTGSVNGSVGTTRYDFVCLRQYYSGTSAGKQDIVLVEGGSSTDPVATSTESDLTKFIRGSTIYDLPIARAKLANGSTVYTVDTFPGGGDYPYAGVYINNIPNTVAFGNDVSVTDDLTTADLIVTGDATLGDTAADRVTLYAQFVLAGTSPTAVSTATAVADAAATSITFGNDTAFETSTTAKASPAAGTILTVTFASTRATSNYTVTVTPRSSAASSLPIYITSKNGTGFSLATSSVPTGGSTLNFAFQVI